MLRMKDNYANFKLPEGYVKGYADINTQTSYITLENGIYTYHTNGFRFDGLTSESIEELESIIDDSCMYELSIDQYTLYTNL